MPGDAFKPRLGTEQIHVLAAANDVGFLPRGFAVAAVAHAGPIRRLFVTDHMRSVHGAGAAGRSRSVMARRGRAPPGKTAMKAAALSGRRIGHPRHAETIDNHAEARGRRLWPTASAPRLRQRGHRTAVRPRHRRRQSATTQSPGSEASLAATVRRQHGWCRRCAGLRALSCFRRRAGSCRGMRLRGVLEAGKPRHPGAELGAVELDRFFAGALKERASVELHGVFFSSGLMAWVQWSRLSNAGA